MQGFQKLRNIERDSRVAVTVSDPDNPFRHFQVRGRVVEMTTVGGAEHIEQLSWKYMGSPYVWHGGRNQVRVIVRIAAEKISGVGRVLHRPARAASHVRRMGIHDMTDRAWRGLER